MTSEQPSAGWPGVIEAYRDRIPVPGRRARSSRCSEGGTPLLPAPHLSELTGCRVTSRSRAPTRPARSRTAGMTVAITHALAGRRSRR